GVQQLSNHYPGCRSFRPGGSAAGLACLVSCVGAESAFSVAGSGGPCLFGGSCRGSCFGFQNVGKSGPQPAPGEASAHGEGQGYQGVETHPTQASGKSVAGSVQLPAVVSRQPTEGGGPQRYQAIQNKLGAEGCHSSAGKQARDSGSSGAKTYCSGYQRRCSYFDHCGAGVVCCFAGSLFELVYAAAQTIAQDVELILKGVAEVTVVV